VAEGVARLGIGGVLVEPGDIGNPSMSAIRAKYR
jgi:hypothetical protein